MADFTAGNVLTAAQLDTAFNTFTINDETGTTYTLAASDAGEMVSIANNSGGTVTIPLNATVPFETGTHIHIVNAGTAGTYTIAGTGGVTLDGAATTLAAGAAASVYKSATNTWRVLPFSTGSAAPTVSGTTGSPATSTVTLSGVTGTLYNFGSNGSITTTAGRCRVCVIGGGGYYWASNGDGTAGTVFDGWIDLTAATHTVTVGAAAPSLGDGGKSSIGAIAGANGGQAGGAFGAGYWIAGTKAAGQPSDITGASVTYGKTGGPPTEYGDGSTNGVTGIAGRVFIFIPN